MASVIVSPIPQEIEDIGYRAIGCGITAHEILGPGYRELVYHRAYALELEAQGLKFETEKRILIPYRDRLIDGHRLDFLIEGCVIVELKVVPKLKELHRRQVLAYLKATKLRLGFVMNFDEVVLKNGIKRVVN